MRCPKCNYNKSSVIDSRQAEDGNTIRRRRECENWFNVLQPLNVEEPPLLVIKKTERVNNFLEKNSKWYFSVHKKRPVSSDDIEQVVSRIEQKFVVNTKVKFEYQIGNLVMDELAELG